MSEVETFRDLSTSCQSVAGHAVVGVAVGRKWSHCSVKQGLAEAVAHVAALVRSDGYGVMVKRTPKSVPAGVNSLAAAKGSA